MDKVMEEGRKEQQRLQLEGELEAEADVIEMVEMTEQMQVAQENGYVQVEVGSGAVMILGLKMTLVGVRERMKRRTKESLDVMVKVEGVQG